MVATRQVTIEEFARLSREGSWELIDGEPVAVNPAAGRVSRIGGRLYARLDAFVEAGNLGWAYPADAGFVLFDDRATVRSPDAAVVLKSRIAEEPDGFFPAPPDLAVEVLSHSDRMADALAKVATYLEAGVSLVWLIDPATRTINVFRQDAAPITLHETDVLDGGDLLPGFSVPVAEIFAE